MNDEPSIIMSHLTVITASFNTGTHQCDFSPPQIMVRLGKEGMSEARVEWEQGSGGWCEPKSLPVWRGAEPAWKTSLNSCRRHHNSLALSAPHIHTSLLIIHDIVVTHYLNYGNGRKKNVIT